VNLLDQRDKHKQYNYKVRPKQIFGGECCRVSMKRKELDIVYHRTTQGAEVIIPHVIVCAEESNARPSIRGPSSKSPFFTRLPVTLTQT
jgi:hypothetical protein